MRKLKIFISAVLVLATLASFGMPMSAETTPSDPVMNVDYDDFTSVENKSYTGGSSISMNASDQNAFGTQTCKASIMTDGTQKVLYWEREAGMTKAWSGATLNPVGLKSSFVVSIKMKVKDWSGDWAIVLMPRETSTVDTSAVGQANAQYPTWAITGGDIYAEINHRQKKNWNGNQVKIGTVPEDEYFTISTVYDLKNVKISIYLNGTFLYETDKFISDKDGGTQVMNGTTPAAPDVSLIKRIYLNGAASNTGDGNTDAGKVYIDNISVYNETEPTETIAPQNVGVQDKVDSNKYSVRFCATIDTLDYSKVGLKIRALDAENNVLKTTEYSASNVYTSIYALGTKVTANEIGGQYLLAYAITDIPDNLGVVKFEITPYGVKDGVTYNGRVIVATYNGSSFVSIK